MRPIYDFRCEQDHTTEERVTSYELLYIRCPVCGKKAKRIMSMGHVGFDLRGTGFYKNDYGPKHMGGSNE
jgi:putative FmdB family regulatory protein